MRNTAPEKRSPDRLDRLLDRFDVLLDRIEAVLPATAKAPDWRASSAFRWRKHQGAGFLQPVARPHGIRFGDLQGVDRQKALIEANTRQFVAGKPANNVLLTGARGTGKSALALCAAAGVSGTALANDDVKRLSGTPGQVVMPNYTYNGWNYSTLDQINLTNVKNLQIGRAHV